MIVTPYAIDCVGVSKTFVQRTIPVRRLQDRLIGFGRRGEEITIHALTQVSLQVKVGEWVAVCGPNGSGKTTLIKIIAGLMLPDHGAVNVAGSISTFFDLGVGFHRERTARENIRIYGLLKGLSTKEIKAMMERIIAYADIGAVSDLPVKCYSTGMLLRLSFAATAHVDADVYLFDEMLAVGDESFRAKSADFFIGLKRAGKSAILVGNNERGLAQFADRIVHLDHGRIAQ